MTGFFARCALCLRSGICNRNLPFRGAALWRYGLRFENLRDQFGGRLVQLLGGLGSGLLLFLVQLIEESLFPEIEGTRGEISGGVALLAVV